MSPFERLSFRRQRACFFSIRLDAALSAIAVLARRALKDSDAALDVLKFLRKRLEDIILLKWNKRLIPAKAYYALCFMVRAFQSVERSYPIRPIPKEVLLKFSTPHFRDGTYQHRSSTRNQKTKAVQIYAEIQLQTWNPLIIIVIISQCFAPTFWNI